MTRRQEKAKHDEFNSETLDHWKRGEFLGPPECLSLVLFFTLSIVEEAGGREGYLSKMEREVCLKPETLDYNQHRFGKIYPRVT